MSTEAIKPFSAPVPSSQPSAPQKSEPVVPGPKTDSNWKVKELDDAYVVAISNRTVSYNEDGEKEVSFSRSITKTNQDGSVESKLVIGTIGYDENGKPVKDIQRF